MTKKFCMWKDNLFRHRWHVLCSQGSIIALVTLKYGQNVHQVQYVNIKCLEISKLVHLGSIKIWHVVAFWCHWYVVHWNLIVQTVATHLTSIKGKFTLNFPTEIWSDLISRSRAIIVIWWKMWSYSSDCNLKYHGTSWSVVTSLFLFDRLTSTSTHRSSLAIELTKFMKSLPWPCQIQHPGNQTCSFGCF